MVIVSSGVRSGDLARVNCTYLLYVVGWENGVVFVLVDILHVMLM